MDHGYLNDIILELIEKIIGINCTLKSPFWLLYFTSKI